MPVGPIKVGGRGRVHAFCYPQMSFGVKRIIVASFCAEAFSVIGIYAAMKPQLIGGCPIPADTFTEQAVHFGLDVIAPGQWLLIQLKNKKHTPRTFSGAFMGIGGLPFDQRLLSAEIPSGLIRVICRFDEVFEGKETDYHTWAKSRDRLYASLFFPNECTTKIVGLDTDRFRAAKGRWWCDKHGRLKRPLYAFEETDDLHIGRVLGGLTVINPETYEGFDGDRVIQAP